jgi:prepilin peptidase CpaA
MVVVALAGAICDVRSLTIPNAVPALIAGLFVPYAVFVPMAWKLAALSTGIATGVCAVGFGLFAAGLAGGGDAKLLAAVSLWAGPGDLATLLLATAIAGAGLALLLAVPPVARAMRALRHGTPAAAAPRNALPYGVAIAAGTVLVALGRVG